MTTRWWALFVWLFIGCAKSTSPSVLAYDAPPSMSARAADYGDAEESYAEFEATPTTRGIDTTDRGPAPRPAEIRPGQAAPQRMVHYEGWTRMRATRPVEMLDAVAALALDAGGRVDRLTDRDVTIRIPIDAFDTTWEAVLALGDVLDKSVRADDITEQFLAVDLRVRTLKTMQTRLVRLLARAKSDEEKLSLLQQITRVTEELDSTESRLRTLKDLAAMSTIRVEAVPRESFVGRMGAGELDGFEWIGSLSPFNRAIWESTKRIGLDTPDEMVALSKRGPYIAESADGVVVWTMRVPNDPIGTGDFWATAVLDRIGDEFEGARQVEVGGWACLTMQEPGADAPYRWDVCVKPSGKHLQISQTYFPGPDQVTRYADDIADSLRAAGGDT